MSPVSPDIIILGTSPSFLKASFARDSNKLAVGRFVRENTPSESVLLVIGDDWSSAFSYHSERRSLTLPDWQKIYSTPQEALDKSEEWLGGNPLGAIIEKENGQQQLSKTLACNSKTEQQFGEWRLSICS